MSESVGFSADNATCICQYDAWVYITVIKTLSTGNFYWNVWGNERIQCTPHGRDTEGNWESQGSTSWSDSDSVMVSWNLHTAKQCGSCLKRPCGGSKDTPISGGGSGSSSYNNLPDFAKKVFDGEGFFTEFLDYMDATYSWNVGGNPAKKTCAQAGDSFCKGVARGSSNITQF